MCVDQNPEKVARPTGDEDQPERRKHIVVREALTTSDVKLAVPTRRDHDLKSNDDHTEWSMMLRFRAG